MKKQKMPSKSKKQKKYTKPILEVIGQFDTMTGGIVFVGGGSKQSNQSDGAGVPATKASVVAMPD